MITPLITTSIQETTGETSCVDRSMIFYPVINIVPAHFEPPVHYNSESDDYDDEDAEEENRRVAFEGPYDAEEGRGTRGNSSSGGSVEVFDLMSSSDEEQEEAPDESIPHAEAVENDSSPEEEPTETEILNEVVDDYIGAAAAQPTEVQLPEVNDGKILYDNVTEYIAVSSPSKKSPEKVARSTTADSADTAVASDEVAAEITNNATEDDAQAVGECYRNQASIGADVETNNANQAPLSDEKPELDPIDTRSKNALEHTSDEIQELHEEADKSEPYSSDGGNLGEEFSEDMADDEHESLDTEDDKRSLAEQGETFDEEEAGPSSPVHFDANEDSDAMMETDQPSILVAAAMSSQHQGSSSYPMVMTKSYRRSSLKSVDNVAAADNEINDRELAPESSALRPEHTSTKEPIDLMGSDNDVQGGALTDDGYVPDVELTEEEKIEKKKVRTIEDGEFWSLFISSTNTNTHCTHSLIHIFQDTFLMPKQQRRKVQNRSQLEIRLSRGETFALRRYLKREKLHRFLRHPLSLLQISQPKLMMATSLRVHLLRKKRERDTSDVLAV
jgi:hypothetical protein